jgi:hypothetical protein
VQQRFCESDDNGYFVMTKWMTLKTSSTALGWHIRDLSGDVALDEMVFEGHQRHVEEKILSDI